MVCRWIGRRREPDRLIDREIKREKDKIAKIIDR